MVDSPASVQLGGSRSVVNDREIGLRILYEDPDSGAEHYLIRYPAGLKTRLHRFALATLLVVLASLDDRNGGDIDARLHRSTKNPATVSLGV
jgi:hypothetical protein